MKKLPLLILVLLSIPTLYAQDVSEGLYIKKTNESQFNLLKSRNEFTIDHISEQGFELYGPVGTSQFLKFNNIEFVLLKKIPVTIAATYPGPEEIELELKSLTTKYSSISKMFSIGNSVKKRAL